MIGSEKLNEFLNDFFEGKKFDFDEICKGGSDRKFYRVSNLNKSCILSISSDFEEYRYYCAFARYFREHGICVPEFYFTIPEEGIAVMFDAGTESLCDYTQKHSDGENFAIYSKVIDKLFDFQEMDFNNCLEISERQFDYEAILWETSYFSQFFLNQYSKIEDIPDEVKEEFLNLAKILSKLPRVPMHRDFQSQNIFIKDGEIYFIDFQGARLGNRFYDLASLIRDPYVKLSRGTKHSLENIFLEKLADKTGEKYSYLMNMFSLNSASRLMQALGAYANLGLNKHKSQFLNYIEPGLKNLSIVLENCLILKNTYNFLLNRVI